jgi:hypothetical protein
MIDCEGVASAGIGGLGFEGVGGGAAGDWPTVAAGDVVSIGGALEDVLLSSIAAGERISTPLSSVSWVN